MNFVSRLNRVLWMLVVAGAICLGADFGKAASGDAGRLVVQRSPKFGTTLFLQIWIDGQSVGTVSQGQRYDQPIAAGNHKISVNSTPNSQRQPNSTALTVRPGQTYAFTATWDNSRGVVLRPSS